MYGFVTSNLTLLCAAAFLLVLWAVVRDVQQGRRIDKHWPLWFAEIQLGRVRRRKYGKFGAYFDAVQSAGHGVFGSEEEKFTSRTNRIAATGILFTVFLFLIAIAKQVAKLYVYLS